MFFFGRKKLYEIEAKIDRLSQILEKHMQDICDNEKNGQQLLAELIIEKTETIANEDKRRIEEVEMQLQIIEAKIADLVDRNIDAIKNLARTQKMHDKSQKDMFNDINKIIGKEQVIEKENIEKLDLIENEIRMLLVNSVMDQLDRKESEGVSF